MQRLSQSTFLYKPDVSSNIRTPTTDPKVVLLLGWMDARENHLAWFVNKYRVIYPHSTIILVKARTLGLAHSSIGRADAQAAVYALRNIFDGEDDDVPDDKPVNKPQDPRLLIHVFSGGGSSTLYHLYERYAAHGDPRKRVLPLHTTIFDSAPGVWTYRFASDMFTAGIKSPFLRALAWPFAHLIAILSWLLTFVLGVMPDGQTEWAEAHNDWARVREARRTYIYGNPDRLVSPGTIEAHANQAEVKGFVVFARELFEGSTHVAHARTDPERYWRVVTETWAGGRC